MPIKYLEVNLPFSGFYESSHDAMIEDAVKDHFQDCDTGDDMHAPYEIWHNTDWESLRQAYIVEYTDALLEKFTDETGLQARVQPQSEVQMESPREYNFTTDRLFIKVRSSDVSAWFAVSKKDDDHATLRNMIEERFTSRDGFASFYSNDLREWLAEKPVTQWDHNQLGTLFNALLELALGDDWERELEGYYLLEDALGNGFLNNESWDALTPELCEFAEYIREATDSQSANRHEPLDMDEWREWVTAGEPCNPQDFDDWINDPENRATVPTKRCTKTPDLFNVA